MNKLDEMSVILMIKCQQSYMKEQTIFMAPPNHLQTEKHTQSEW